MLTNINIETFIKTSSNDIISLNLFILEKFLCEKEGLTLIYSTSWKHSTIPILGSYYMQIKR